MNRIAFVAGARGGIGRALVAAWQTDGRQVAAAGRDAATLADVPAALAHGIGSTLIAPLHRTRAQAWSGVRRVNLDSAFFMLGAWVAARERQAGAAAFASSVLARTGVANHEATVRLAAGR